MKVWLLWLCLALAVAAEGGRRLTFDCVPRDFQVAVQQGDLWQPCPRNLRNQVEVPDTPESPRFRLMRQGYQTLELQVPAAHWKSGPEQRWPPALHQVLTLSPQILQATFHTRPAGAQIFLISAAGRQEYLGLSGQPLSLNLARLTGGSGQGYFEIEFRHWGCLPSRVPIASYTFSPGQNRWPASGSLPLPLRYPLWPAVPALLLGALWLRRQSSQRPSPLNRPCLGDYWIRQALGWGAAGKVFRAEHRHSGRPVAIKVLHAHLADQSIHLAAFRREAALLAELDHPNLVKVLEWGEDLGRPYLVMELVEGSDLRTALSVDALGATALAPLLVQAASGLAWAHSQHIVHRDIKPENLIVTAAGRACWVDFGLAEVEPTPDDVSGTSGYLAPERLAGAPASPASDQYALGVLAYEALTGELPGTTPELKKLRPALCPHLTEVIQRMLSHHPSDRYPSLLEVERALWAGM
ncbi:hypothetical protein ABS71_17210 [bacterium SCN 62-11]|nr:serine/threonine protein kinase [Candidatus Eremiobacteraeota bacterium]ODT60671.1 MAG: hypothetical protein ABS71_17210 [bacterium SCN 62-11]